MRIPNAPKTIPHRTLVGAGVILFLLGAWFLRSAYEGSGKQTPWWARPVTFW